MGHVPYCKASEVILSPLVEHISEQNLSHTLPLCHTCSHRRPISLASLNSSKINFLQACMLLTRGQRMYSSFMAVNLNILTPSKLSWWNLKQYLAALITVNRHFQSWTYRKLHFVFGFMKNISTFHYTIILEVLKQIFTSWQRTPDLRNPTKECNDSMNIPIHWNTILQYCVWNM